MDSEGAPPGKIERIPFKPDRLPLAETVDKIKKLENGDLLFLSHTAVIICEGDQKILCDLSPEGILVTNKKTGDPIDVYPTSLKDALMANQADKDKQLPPILKVLKPFQQLVTKEPRSQQDWSMFVDVHGQPVSPIEAAAQIAPQINAISVSHLDPDHFNVEFLDQSVKNNPNLQIIVPLGFVREVAKYYNIPEVDSTNQNRPTLPENLIKKIKSLSPYNPRENSFDEHYGLEMHKTQIGNCRITSYEIPHMTLEYNQALLIQKDETEPGTLYLPDAALSPESLKLVRQLSEDGKISRICLSIAKLQPDPMYDIVPLEFSKKVRDDSEEHLFHSAYIIPAMAAVTGDGVEIYIDHLGSFFRSSRDSQYLGYRLPIEDEQTANKHRTEPDNFVTRWRWQFTDFINKMIDDPVYSNLPALTRSKDRQIAAKSNEGLSKRKDFSQSVIQYLTSNPIPREILSRIHIPGPNEVIKGHD
ncbi:hypothetical protein A2397_01740 [Candidatus Amesbacteria bacterium RIFOXYB1_FULL_44_23]|uniref:Uncharacterized protein n=1 Tax=Candidatus Amesbacteria bacterium RIFOXYB1_FULL_44_23 TaxID=1797263 RepID=A0A1F4ZUK2_9BACT|nr:MAG: hypothetical protein A2397_01740 [Candidatus Amesbacteria bacterium RIFOXYB1_FULL_44_23]